MYTVAAYNQLWSLESERENVPSEVIVVCGRFLCALLQRIRKMYQEDVFVYAACGFRLFWLISRRSVQDNDHREG